MFINNKRLIFNTLYFQERSLTGSSVFPFWEPTANNTKWAQNGDGSDLSGIKV